MADIESIRHLVAGDGGLASVAIARSDGTVHATVVNAGVLDHPLEDRSVVGMVVRGDTVKHRRLRKHGLASVTWRVGWEWATVEGPTQLIGPDDPVDGVDRDRLRELLRQVFRSAGGTHDDFDEFDRVMLEERRLAVLVSPERIYGVTRT